MLFVLPLDRQFAYHFLENDCYGHASWIHDRIHLNENEIDIAFLGTSATIQAIYEEAIENVLDSTYGQTPRLANLGYCRPGRNLHYILLEELLSEKKVNTIILEVREKEDRYSHPVFPNLAKREDVLKPVWMFNRDIASDWVNALLTRYAYRKQKFLHNLSLEYPVDTLLFGYGAGTRIAPEKELQEMLEKRREPKAELSQWQKDFYAKYPKAYIEKIADLCEENEVKLVFLFLHFYGVQAEEPTELDYYNGLGEIWLPPKAIFEKPSNWMDPDHLNINGANELAPWLASKIASMQGE
ncbi:MAG: hypothetical protein AAF502_13420 [Bacteroidota bacterium]